MGANFFELIKEYTNNFVSLNSVLSSIGLSNYSFSFCLKIFFLFIFIFLNFLFIYFDYLNKTKIINNHLLKSGVNINYKKLANQMAVGLSILAGVITLKNEVFDLEKSRKLKEEARKFKEEAEILMAKTKEINKKNEND